MRNLATLLALSIGVAAFTLAGAVSAGPLDLEVDTASGDPRDGPGLTKRRAGGEPASSEGMIGYKPFGPGLQREPARMSTGPRPRAR